MINNIIDFIIIYFVLLSITYIDKVIWAMLLAETRYGFAWQTTVSAVAATWIALATATPGAIHTISIATDFLLAGLMVMILSTKCATTGIIAILCQLVQNLDGLAAIG